jgi:hypothetical protein
MTCIPTLFQRLSEVLKPTLQRLQVLSIRSHVHAFLSLAPSPSLALIHSSPSSSCSLSHVLFQSLSLSLTEFQSIPSSLLQICVMYLAPSIYTDLYTYFYRLLQVPTAPGRGARANYGSGRASWLPPGWTHLAFRGIYPTRTLSPIPLTTNPSLSMRGRRVQQSLLLAVRWRTQYSMPPDTKGTDSTVRLVAASTLQPVSLYPHISGLTT